ncbi:MAG: MopE-related protein, partial [Saprospiraceae bacterium]
MNKFLKPALYFLLFLFLGNHHALSAQELLWDNSFSGEFNEFGFRVVSNPDGGNTAIGFTVDDNSDFFQTNISRYSAEGEEIYFQRFEATKNILALASLPNGHNLIGGAISTNGLPLFGLEGEAFVPYLAILSATGELIQEITFNEFAGKSGFFDLLSTTQGYVAQISVEIDDERNFLQIAKLSPQLTIEWTAEFTENQWDEINDFTVDTEGNTYTAGYFSSSQLDQIAKVDPNGNILWTRNFNSSESIDINAITIAPDGNIVAYGDDGGDINNENYIVVRKYDQADGSVIWENLIELSPYINASFGGDFFYGSFSIETALDNNGFILSGFTNGDIDLTNDGSTPFDSTTPLTILRLNLDGELVWHEFYAPEFRSFVNDICINADNSISVVGTRLALGEENEENNFSGFISRINDLAAANCVDLDNDNFCADIDCDDNNPNIFPGATEIPNNDIDENCDGIDTRGCEGDIELTTQTEVDNFATQYPDCDTFTGSLIIQSDANDPITNLNGLTQITRIDGFLFINQCNELTDLTGLDNLTFIGTQLAVSENQNLTSLTGLNNLQTINEILLIENNARLGDISALAQLSSPIDIIQIVNCPTLSRLPRFTDFTTINRILQIDNCDALGDFSGFESITTVQNIIISNNENLLDLQGFNNLGDVQSINIANNPNLSNCAIESICDFIENETTEFIIQDNADGCQSANQISIACVESNAGLCTTNLIFASQADINAFNSNCQIIDGFVVIGGPDIVDLTPLSSIVEIRDDLLILGNGAGNNSLLTSLAGLENIRIVGDIVSIDGNENLSNCCAVEVLINTAVGGSVTIENNAEGCNNVAEITTTCSDNGGNGTCELPASISRRS